jgi:WD40 repeat protein
MTRTTEMNEIIEERYQLCIWLYRIKKETDKRNKAKRERGEKNLVYISIFAIPSHIKKLFGDFLKTPPYTEIATLKGHVGGVCCITLHENKLYSGNDVYLHSGNYDDAIRIWNTETHEPIASLKGYIEGVCCFTLHENKLYSGDFNRTIRVWNTETHEEIATLRGHTATVCIVSLITRTNCILGVGIILSAFGTQKLTKQ